MERKATQLELNVIEKRGTINHDREPMSASSASSSWTKKLHNRLAFRNSKSTLTFDISLRMFLTFAKFAEIRRRFPPKNSNVVNYCGTFIRSV